jgi:mRNA-degrading endonuclease toxin of MazEF toxin-antitoxin module
VSPTRLPRLGSVVWAELEDANSFRKLRPVVDVTPTVEIAPGKPVRVVAITTRLPNTLPDDHVLLPWDRQGKARSGLRRRCAAVASWQAEISVDDIQQVVGILPPAVIGELLAKVAATLPAPSATQAPGPGDPSAQPSEGPREAPPPPAEDGPGDRTDEIA